MPPILLVTIKGGIFIIPSRPKPIASLVDFKLHHYPETLTIDRIELLKL
jgi:hypothetical protein